MADKAEVLGLRKNVYRGLDYLPDYYDFFVNDRNRRCIVGELDSKVVSFGTMLTLDGGRSILGQAGRIHEQHEGKGFFSTLSQYINQQAQANGCAQRVALVETTLNKYARSEKFRKTHAEVASKMHYAGLVTTEMRTSFFRNRDKDMFQMLHDVKITEMCTLEEYFTTESICRVLFPHGRLLVDYIPYRIMSENVRLLTGRNTQFFSNVTVSENETKGLLTAGTIYKCENPKESYIIDIFGNDADSLEKHFLFHLWRALKQTSGEFCLQFFVEKGYIAQRLCQILIKYDVPKCNWYVEGGVSTKSIVEEPLN